MTNRIRTAAIVGVLIVLLGLLAIGSRWLKPKPTGIANPASVYCDQQGGRIEIVADALGNQTGLCHLPDGRVCEEWSLYRDKQCVVQ